MIHDLIITSKEVRFTWINQVGKAFVKILRDDLIKGKEKLIVTEYSIFGFTCDHSDPVHLEVIKIIANELHKLAENNGWVVWNA